jgi:BMFP domain-containing protein YqiC
VTKRGNGQALDLVDRLDFIILDEIATRARSGNHIF